MRLYVVFSRISSPVQLLCTAVPRIFVQHLSLRNYKSNFDAFEADTHLKRNLNYLRENPRYANTTFQDRNIHVFCLNGESTTDTQNQMLDKLRFNVSKEDEYQNSFFEHLGKIDSRTIRSLNKSEVQELLYTLAHFKNHNVSDSFVSVLDLECARRVRMWNAGASLLAIDIWIEWLGHRASHKAFFNMLLKEWRFLADCQVLQHLVQLLYYIGLRKSSFPDLMASIEEWLELDDITTLANKEVIIICQGYFKTSTRLSSQKVLFDVSRRVKSMLTEKVDEYGEYDLISMLKVLRHAKYEHAELIASLSECLKCQFLRPSNMTSLAHLMATFANSKVYDRQLFCKCEEQFLDAIAVGNLHPPPRLKDTARILWALSSLSHCTVDRQFDSKVVSHLHKQVKGLKQQEKPHFIDCLHSLGVFGIFPQHLLQMSFNFDVSSSKIAMKMKPLRQLNFLAESLRIEVPNYAGSFHQVSAFILYENLNSELRRRPMLDMIRVIVRDLCAGDDDLFACDYLLSHIPIAGIELNLNIDGKICGMNRVADIRCAIEVLDSTVCIDGSTAADGFMSAKLRQLHRKGYDVVKISLGDLEHLADGSPMERVSWMRCHLSKLLRLPIVTI